MRSLIDFLGRRICVGSFVLLPLQRESRPGLSAGFCRGRQSPTVAPLAVEIARIFEARGDANGAVKTFLRGHGATITARDLADLMARCG